MTSRAQQHAAAACLLAALLGCGEPSPLHGGALGAATSELADAGNDAAAPHAADDAGPSAAAQEKGCAAAERLLPTTFSARSVLLADGSTALAADTNRSQLEGCRDTSAGPDRWYALDLSGFEQPVALHAVVDADFDALLELRRGACGDAESLDCDRARGVATTSSSIAARLEPDLYWLIVDGASRESQGDFRLQVELDPAPGSCTGTPAAGSCGAPLPLQLLPRQTVLLDEACFPVDEDDHANAWYDLDLSGESRDVLVHAQAWTLSKPVFQHLRLYEGADDQCGSELVSSYISRGLSRTNAELSALLAPGRYQLELTFDQPPDPHAGLDLEMDRDTCQAGPVANGCEDAIPIDPSLPRQLFDGNTACNADRFEAACEPLVAPEQFYRLDLRGAPGPVRARVTTLIDGLGFEPILALLSADGDGVCPDAVYCDDRIANFDGPPRLDLILDPQLHYLVIDGGDPGAAGPYRLLVELEPAERRPCVDTRIDDCVYGNSETDCCSEWSPACDATVALCGLEPSVQQCVCSTAPACCAPEHDASACQAAQQACNYLCPEFAASTVSVTCLAFQP